MGREWKIFEWREDNAEAFEAQGKSPPFQREFLIRV
jgi:hypothetical protein